MSGHQVRGRGVGSEAEQPGKRVPGFGRFAVLEVCIAEHVEDFVGPRAGGDCLFEPEDGLGHSARKKAALSQNKSGLTILGARGRLGLYGPRERLDRFGVVLQPEREHAGNVRDLRRGRVEARHDLLRFRETAVVEETDRFLDGCGLLHPKRHQENDERHTASIM